MVSFICDFENALVLRDLEYSHGPSGGDVWCWRGYLPPEDVYITIENDSDIIMTYRVWNIGIPFN